MQGNLCLGRILILAPGDFFYGYTADIIFLCAIGCFELQGCTPYETVMNHTPDIHEYASFHGSSIHGSMMRSSKASSYAGG